MAQIATKKKMTYLSQFSTDRARSTHNGHHSPSAIHPRSYFSKIDAFLETRWSVEVKRTVDAEILADPYAKRLSLPRIPDICDLGKAPRLVRRSVLNTRTAVKVAQAVVHREHTASVHKQTHTR